MQKYRLVYQTETEEIDIFLKGKDNEYTNNLELCFIDAFTTVYANQAECIKYLQDKGIVKPSYGKLYIKRPNGKEKAEEIYYKNEDIRTLSLEVCQKLRNSSREKLSETREYKKCSGEIISYFYSNDEAVNALNKSFYANKFKAFVQNLNSYLEYKNHSSFYESGELATREEIRRELYNFLKNYEVLRKLKIWIKNYQNSPKKTSSSSWKNPYEEYEKEQEELEIRKNNL